MDTDPQSVAREAKALGFDALEIFVSPSHIKAFDKIDRDKIRDALQSMGLACIGATALDEDTDISSGDEETRKRGVNCLCDLAQLFSQLGADLLTGTTYGAIGKIIGRAPSTVEWRRIIDSLREVCRRIRKNNMTVGVEPLNRFQTCILNTARDALNLVTDVAEPNIGVHLDTFHMNIEEKGFYEPIVATGSALCHVHVSESDRDVVGSGNVRWENVFKALADIRYDRWLSLAAFTPSNSTIESVWRTQALNPEVLASESLKFIRNMMRSNP